MPIGLRPEELTQTLWVYPEHPDDVILQTLVFIASHGSCVRTKQWMASEDFSLTTVLYPRQLALTRLPLGLPRGVDASF